MSGRKGLAALLLICAAAGPAGGADERDPAAELAKLAAHRRDAARRTYEVLWTNYRERRTSQELLYLWSVRWLEAEKQLSDKPDDQVAACAAHYERMRALERLLEQVKRSGQTTLDETNAAEYYRTEAELWLLQAKERKGR
jgi:hypothetical protein